MIDTFPRNLSFAHKSEDVYGGGDLPVVIVAVSFPGSETSVVSPSSVLHSGGSGSTFGL